MSEDNAEYTLTRARDTSKDELALGQSLEEAKRERAKRIASEVSPVTKDEIKDLLPQARRKQLSEQADMLEKRLLASLEEDK